MGVGTEPTFFIGFGLVLLCRFRQRGVGFALIDASLTVVLHLFDDLGRVVDPFDHGCCVQRYR